LESCFENAADAGIAGDLMRKADTKIKKSRLEVEAAEMSLAEAIASGNAVIISECATKVRQFGVVSSILDDAEQVIVQIAENAKVEAVHAAESALLNALASDDLQQLQDAVRDARVAGASAGLIEDAETFLQDLQSSEPNPPARPPARSTLLGAASNAASGSMPSELCGEEVVSNNMPPSNSDDVGMAVVTQSVVSQAHDREEQLAESSGEHYGPQYTESSSIDPLEDPREVNGRPPEKLVESPDKPGATCHEASRSSQVSTADCESVADAFSEMPMHSRSPLGGLSESSRRPLGIESAYESSRNSLDISAAVSASKARDELEALRTENAALKERLALQAENAALKQRLAIAATSAADEQVATDTRDIETAASPRKAHSHWSSARGVTLATTAGQKTSHGLPSSVAHISDMFREDASTGNAQSRRSSARDVTQLTTAGNKTACVPESVATGVPEKWCRKCRNWYFECRCDPESVATGLPTIEDRVNKKASHSHWSSARGVALLASRLQSTPRAEVSLDIQGSADISSNSKAAASKGKSHSSWNTARHVTQVARLGKAWASQDSRSLPHLRAFTRVVPAAVHQKTVESEEHRATIKSTARSNLVQQYLQGGLMRTLKPTLEDLPDLGPVRTKTRDMVVEALSNGMLQKALHKVARRTEIPSS